MAIVQRFFSTAGAGAADGTSWANRAQLHNAGTWSTVITGFAFNGADSLQCFIGPGTYTITAALVAGAFANPPTVANPLIFVGCDSSGVQLTIPNPGWFSCQPAWDDSTLPVLATTTNVPTTTLLATFWYLVKFTASGRTGRMIDAAGMDWCVVNQTTANTSAQGAAPAMSHGCVFTCSGSSYDTVVVGIVNATNCRIEGVTGSSGNRRGFTASSALTQGAFMTVVNNGGEGVICTSTSAGQSIRFSQSVIANNGATGFKANSTASQTSFYTVQGLMVTGNVTGIDGNSGAGRIWVEHTRLRDNTTDMTGLGNYPTDLNNYTTDDSDANEYVSTGADGDFSIKNTATNVWGKGFGVRDQPADSGVSGIIGDGATW